MEIDEVKAKKLETEKAIRNLLVDFAEKTGLVVEDVRFEMMDISSMGGSRKMECSSVFIDIRLG